MLFQMDYITPIVEPGDVPPHDPLPGSSVELQGSEDDPTIFGVILVAQQVDQAADAPQRMTLSIQISDIAPGLPEFKAWVENVGDVGIKVLPQKNSIQS